MSNTWHNWAGDQICAPSVIKRPTSEAELVEIVAGAAQKGERVRAVGTGHSFTDCACTDGVMIDMTGLQRVIDVDSAKGLATVEGGAELHPFLARLAERGFGIENQGDIDKQSITGAAATATHGTRARFKNLSAQMVSARLVTAGGEVLEVSEDSDSDAYLAVGSRLGHWASSRRSPSRWCRCLRCTVPTSCSHWVGRSRGSTRMWTTTTISSFCLPLWGYGANGTTDAADEEPRPRPVWKKRLAEEFECRAEHDMPRRSALPEYGS